MTRLHDLEDWAEMAGLVVRTHSPGDGVTRYRFFRDSAPTGEGDGSDYFSGFGCYTALGMKEALAFVAGARAVQGLRT